MITSDLNNVIKDYLSTKDTDYAVMISGDWGSGKSYYISHRLNDLVKSTPVPTGDESDSNNKEKYYSLAYISLYGVSSSEDFLVRVFNGINPWLNNQFWRLSGLITSKTAGFWGISFRKKDVQPITFIRKNRVLVFDDLERICEDKISVKEVLGLINTYTEHSHYKVIIVCNERRYTIEGEANNAKDSFKEHKEKSVRFTYEFSPDEREAYYTMVSAIPSGDYHDFLVKEEASFLSLFNLGGKRNLRTLKFILDTFGKLYGLTQEAKYKDRVTRVFLVTFVLYACEYKQGITVEELESLDISKNRIDSSVFSNLYRKDMGSFQEDKKKDYESIFKERYESVYDDFCPCSSIIRYIESGFLDKDSFRHDIQKLDNELDRLVLKPEGIVYQKLLRMTELDDSEVMPLIEELLSYVSVGKYNLYDLLRIYVLLLKYDYWKISGFELTGVIDSVFKDAMERLKGHHQYNAMFDVKTPIFDSSDRDTRPFVKYGEMKKIAMVINLLAKKETEAKDGRELMVASEQGDIEKIRSFRATEEHRISVSGIDWDRMMEVLKGASNPVACEVCECLISITPEGGLLNPDEADRIKSVFLPALEDYLKSDTRQIRRIYIKELRDHLNDVVR